MLNQLPQGPPSKAVGWGGGDARGSLHLFHIHSRSARIVFVPYRPLLFFSVELIRPGLLAPTPFNEFFLAEDY